MIINLVQINFNSHRVHVSRDDDTGQIICFKYDGSACDFQSFESDAEYACADWIVEPLPTISYRVVVGGE